MPGLRVNRPSTVPLPPAAAAKASSASANGFRRSAGHAADHVGYGLPPVPQYGPDQLPSRHGQFEPNIPPVGRVIPAREQAGNYQPFTDSGRVGGVHSEFGSHPAEVLRAPRIDQDQDPQLGAGHGVLHLDDGSRGNTQQYVGGRHDRFHLPVGGR